MNHFFKLGFFPTPIEELKNLSNDFSDYQIFTKRDDNTGLATGGNKTRKLEYLLQDALDQDADTIISAGAQQSNHCRQTAAAAAKAGMKCHLVLGGHQPKNEFTGNLLLSKLLGAELHFMGEQRKGEDIPQIKNDLIKAGKRPYVIPYGGSNSVGALGYVRAIKELKEQSKELNLNFDYIYFGSSSGGTHAGMIMGKELFKLDSKIIGIQIDKDKINGLNLNENILKIIGETQEKLNISREFKLDEINLLEDYGIPGYGVLTDHEAYAINLLAKSEGILVDPVYTGRAFYGMIDQLKNNKIKKGSKVLFWHTGGFPATYNYLEQLSK